MATLPNQVLNIPTIGINTSQTTALNNAKMAMTQSAQSQLALFASPAIADIGTILKWKTVVPFNEPIPKHHLEIWKTCSLIDIDDWNIISPSDGEEIFYEKRSYFMIFSSRKNMNTFKKWWKSYKARFGNLSLDKSFFPTLPDGNFNGYMVRTEDEIYSHTQEKCFKHWQWIVSNCRGKVFLIPNCGWIFQSVTEATVFKLWVQ